MGAFVGGLHTRAALIRHDGNHHGIAIELCPTAARAVLGIPAGELSGTVVSLEDLLDARATELVERLPMADSWARRFTILDEVLARRLADRHVPDPVLSAFRRVVDADTAVSIRSLCAAVGWSRRHLSEQFHREVGLSPSEFGRVVRFERSCRLLRRRHRSQAAVAAEAGYFDESHLIREWKRLAGCTPSQWLHEELPSVQANVHRVDTD